MVAMGYRGWVILWGLCLSSSLGAQIQFSDVTEAAGLANETYFSPTNHSLGINWIDFNDDGWPDLFMVGGGPGRPPHLFRNEQDGTFSRVGALLPTLPDVEMTGARFADFDRDGDQDLFIYTDNHDWCTHCEDNEPDGPPNLLLKNLWAENGSQTIEGQPLFQEVAAAAGIDDLAPSPFGTLPAYRSKTAAWLDYDRDGCIDLFVGHMVINSGGSEANKDRLFRNRCDGTFEDATVASGLNPGSDPQTFRAALASGGFHLNDDLWPDLYVVNASFREEIFHADFVFTNQGRGEEGVTFVETTGVNIGNDSQGGMGVDVADIDLDGDWDLYITDVIDSTLDQEPLGNVLYLNDGAGGFLDNTAPEAGVQGHNSWGANFFDADRDGWEDLFISTIINAGTDFLFHNQGPGIDGRVSFTNVAQSAGIETLDSRGSAAADFDRDGDVDIAVVNQNGPMQLFRNDTVAGGCWLVLELKGTLSNLDAIGTIVEVTTGETVRRRQVKGGSSAHSQDALAVHFGLADVSVADEVRVRWPSGLETILEQVACNRYQRIIEPWIFGDGFESGDLSAWSSSSSFEQVEDGLHSLVDRGQLER